VKILLVDDEDDVRLIAKVSLARLGGMDVLEAATGRDALGLACSAQPDAILLDVQMPGLKGTDTLEALRRLPETRRIPVIFLTAHSAPADVERLLALGAAAVIVKPFEPAALASEVRRVVEATLVSRNSTDRHASHS
jgi:CheY-like chemotaxis protein